MPVNTGICPTYSVDALVPIDAFRRLGHDKAHEHGLAAVKCIRLIVAGNNNILNPDFVSAWGKETVARHRRSAPHFIRVYSQLPFSEDFPA
jgi:hypothetical protein